MIRTHTSDHLKLLLVGLAMVLILLALMAAPASGATLNTLSRSFAELKEYKLVEMLVEKSFSSEISEPKSSSGKLYFSRGKVRLEIKEPKKSLMVLANDDIWFEEYPREKGPAQVSHAKAKKAKESSALLAVLFGESTIWKELQLLKTWKEKGIVYFSLKPKDSKRLEVIDLVIGLSEDINQIAAISYADELANKTEFKFNRVKFIDEFRPKLFRYSPPKGAVVTRF